MAYTGNKNLHSHQETVINSLGPHTILYIEQIKPNTFFIGTGIKAYSFRRCDLILTEDAIVFLGREEDNLVFKNYTRPILLTSDYNKYKDFIPFCTFLEIFSIEIVDGNIEIWKKRNDRNRLPSYTRLLNTRRNKSNQKCGRKKQLEITLLQPHSPINAALLQ